MKYLLAVTGFCFFASMSTLSFAGGDIVRVERISDTNCRAVFTCADTEKKGAETCKSNPLSCFDSTEDGYCLGDIQTCEEFERDPYLRDKGITVPPPQGE